MPTSIVLVSCLADFYGKVREVLAQSYIDRIEKAGPVPLIETRTAEEARLIIAKRLQQDPRNDGTDPTLYFGPQFFEEFGGLSTRRILELAQTRMREQEGDAPPAAGGEAGLHLDTGRGAGLWRRAAATTTTRTPAAADRIPRPLGPLHGAVRSGDSQPTTRA